MQIKNILATKGIIVHTIHPDQTLREVVVALSVHNIGALVVVDQTGSPIGIITERDIVRTASRTDKLLDLRVEEAMTKKVIFGAPDDDVQSVERTMTTNRFRHLPILDQGKLAGIISIVDIVKAQLDENLGKVMTLETQITG